METKKSKKPETKIVNLCEDMNYHEHDDKSYQKMTQEKVIGGNKQSKPDNKK